MWRYWTILLGSFNRIVWLDTCYSYTWEWLSIVMICMNIIWTYEMWRLIFYFCRIFWWTNRNMYICFLLSFISHLYWVYLYIDWFFLFCSNTLWSILSSMRFLFLRLLHLHAALLQLHKKILWNLLLFFSIMKYLL